MDEECPHGRTRDTCLTCKYGVRKRPTAGDGSSYCKLCSDQIIWCVTENGKHIPIDVDSSTAGRFRKVRVESNGDKLVHYVRDSEMFHNTQPLYEAHFATCPYSDTYKKGR